MKFLSLLCCLIVSSAIGQEEKRSHELIGTEKGTWRAASVFTHAIWRDLLFFGGSAGTGGGDPRHEMEIGVFHLDGPRSGNHDPRNPIIKRAQFGLDMPGQGITPLSIIETDGRLLMFCTARPDEDLKPRIVTVEAATDDPFSWGNLTVICDETFTGEVQNHGASAVIDPKNPDRVLLYFAARTPPEEYRILLATAPSSKISDPQAWQLLRDFKNPVLARSDKKAKANYPFVRFAPSRDEFELWYSGHSPGDPKTRSSFVSISKKFDEFSAAKQAVAEPSRDPLRNDAAYATGPKIWNGHLFYSGRRKASGDYRGIFSVKN